MTQTLTQERVVDAVEVSEAYPETVVQVVDTLEMLERIDTVLEADKAALLQAEAEEKIEDLVRNPVEAFAWDVDYMAELYEQRSQFYELTDGTQVQMWGTRDISKVILDFTYVKMKRPDGTVRYDVVRRHHEGTTAYRLDGDAIDVAYIKRPIRQPDFKMEFTPKPLEDDDKEAAIRVLFDSSIAAAATAKVRTPKQQATIHFIAKEMLFEGDVAGLNERSDRKVIERTLDAYQAPRRHSSAL